MIDVVNNICFDYRLYGLLLLYIGAFLKKYNFQEKLKSSLGQFLKYKDDGDTITYKTLKDIDKDQETGHMVLIRSVCIISMLQKIMFTFRILKANPGIYFVETLRKLRDILGFKNKFSILLDIDEKTHGKRKLCEDQFLSCLKRYKVNISQKEEMKTDAKCV